jgi:hypothetical protein
MRTLVTLLGLAVVLAGGILALLQWVLKRP